MADVIPDWVLANGRERYAAKRSAGIDRLRSDGSATHWRTDEVAAAAEWWAAGQLGATYNSSVTTHGDGGQDWTLDSGGGVEVVHLGLRKDGTPRTTGHLIVNPHEPQRWAHYYVVVAGDERGGFRFAGWTTHAELVLRPQADFGYGPRYAMHVRDLRPMASMPARGTA